LRQLLHIPIVHGHAEMGSARNKVRRAYVDRRGEIAWQKSRQVIAEFWDVIEKAVDSLHLDYRKARLYQDGLPTCALEEKIVRDLAARGLPNYRILLKLMERGATLEGTEDPDLLRTEYELIMKAALEHDPEKVGTGFRKRSCSTNKLERDDDSKQSHHALGTAQAAAPPENGPAAQFRDLLDQRDRFIAQRIDATLRGGEIGILFLGALHHAVEKLPNGIHVVSLPQMLEGDD